MRRIIYCIVFLLPFFWIGCKEEGRIDHIDKNAPVPAQVTNIQVFNRPGGATLKYDLPTDENLLYVQAEYEIKPGDVKIRKASFFIDSLDLEGFGDTQEHAVKVFSIGKNEKVSEPTIVTIKPLTPPVFEASKTIDQTFGGVNVKIKNPYKANLAVEVMGDTAKNGYMTILQTFWTTAEQASFTVRGLDSIENNFGVYLRDRWDNMSDTIEATLTPLFEEEIPKSTWAEYSLPGDAPIHNNEYRVSNLWNQDWTNGNRNFHTLDTPLPACVTWDFGITVNLSRLVLWPRYHAGDTWVRGHPRAVEVYGSMNPNPDGSLDETWIPLGKFEFIQPSGIGNTPTAEDNAFARAGHDMEFDSTDFAPDPFVPVRYIRLRIMSTYNFTSISVISIQEVSAFGNIIK